MAAKLTKRVVDAAAPAGKLYRVWDGELKGFGVKVMPSRVKTFIIVYRPNGGGRGAPLKEYTIGRYGTVTPDEARREAEARLAAVRLGGDPQAKRQSDRAEMSIEALCDLYLAEGVATRKPASVKRDVSLIRSHIKPLLGKMRAPRVTSADVAKFVQDVASGKTAKAVKPTKAEAAARQLGHVETIKRNDIRPRGGTASATRTLALLSVIFSFAISRGLRVDNPCKGVKKFKGRQSQRYLSADEAGRMGDALSDPALNSKAVQVLRLLILTACRKTEIQALRWDEIDFNLSILALKDSKTGQKIVPLSAPALQVLTDMRGAYDRDLAAGDCEASPFVFPSRSDPDRHFVGTPKVWRDVRQRAGLEGVRMHDLRHTFASFAAAGGQSLLTIGKILGHASTSTTQRYAHLADDPLKAATHRTSEAIAAALAGNTGQVIPLRGNRS